MAAFDITSAAGILHECIDGQEVNNLTARVSPLLASIPKKTDLAGDDYPLPMVAAGGTAANSFSVAKTYSAASSTAKFKLVPKKLYSVGLVDNMLVGLSKSNKGAFIDALEAVVMTRVSAASRLLATQCYRTSTGLLGRMSAISTGVITLTNPEDANLFMYGQVLESSATDGASPSTATAYGYVIATNPDHATDHVTISATAGGAAGTPTSWSTSDPYLYPAGSAGTSLAMNGLQAWFPATVSGSDSFLSVNRSADRVQMAGTYFDASAYTVLEGLQKLVARVCRAGGAPKKIFMGLGSWEAFQIEATAKKLPPASITGKNGEVYWSGLTIQTEKGPAECFMDPFCPTKEAFALDMESIKLYSVGETVGPLKYQDGNEFRVDNDSDGYQIRIGSFSTIGCNAPGHNGRAILAK